MAMKRHPRQQDARLSDHAGHHHRRLSVTVLVAIGQGSTSDITSRISSLGTT
jgi:hypothetical protein